jgi:membrane protease YdiL (CAAX protease family)
VAQWAPFLVVVAVLTVLLLVLSRQSQALIREFDEQDEHNVDSPGSDADATAGSGRNVSPETGDDTVGPQTKQETAQAGQELELTSTVMLANVASTQALFAGVVLAAAWHFSIPAAALGVTAGPLTGGPLGAGVGLGFGLVLWLANELSTAVADAAGAAYDETVRELLAPESTRGWVGLLLVVLPLIAVAEELLFRAALIGVPVAGFDVSPWPLAVVASLAFALGHGAQGRVGVVVTGLLGLALAGGYILTGSLLVVVVAHYLINAMTFLVHEFLGLEPLSLLAPSSG